MSHPGRTGRVIGFLVSLAIHLSGAALVLWPGGPILQVSKPDQRPRALTADALPQQPTLARPGLHAMDSIKEPTRRHEDDLPLSPEGRKWVDHLWQSTVFAVVAGLLTVAFRRNRAHIRYWLWFGASVKFLVPFSLLVTLGSHLPWAPAVQTVATQAFAVQTGEPLRHAGAAGRGPFPSTLDASGGSWTGLAILGVWTCGFGAVTSMRLRMWRRIRAAVRASTPLEIRGAAIPARIRVRSVPVLLEPGVVGWWRPILLMPADIERHLTHPQLKTVVAHELCHIRRHDNLTAAIHMVVEAIFWFHPLVWWISTRLVDERERACDEHVLRAFGEPRVYAQGILNVCKRYVESPLTCVSGVGGSSLGWRIEAILTNQVGEAVRLWKKFVLGAATIGAVIVPVGVGVLSAPRLQTLSDGPFVAANVPIRSLIGQAYRVSSPRSTESALRALPADRFKPVVHTKTRELPILALVLADSDGRLGPNLTPSSRTDCSAVLAAARGRGGEMPPPPAHDQPPPCSARTFPGTVSADSITLSYLADLISNEVNRTVEDRTGLTGRFNVHLTWPTDQPEQPVPSAPHATILAALHEQLGLKLIPITSQSTSD